MDWKEKASAVGTTATKVPQIAPDDVPDIDLYMDQLVTFLDQRLGDIKRECDQPFVTNTMVNNYTKAHLVPTAVHKRYSRRHLLGLSLVGQLKKVLSMQDLGRITAAVENSDFENGLYSSFLAAQREAFSESEQLIAAAIARCQAQGTEGNAALAAMATELAAQAQCRTLLAERLLDAMESAKPEESRKKSKG